jgi:hypothetical protein
MYRSKKSTSLRLPPQCMILMLDAIIVHYCNLKKNGGEYVLHVDEYAFLSLIHCDPEL